MCEINICAKRDLVNTTFCVSSIIGSNHYGIAGWYSMQAADQGLLVRVVANYKQYTFSDLE